MRRKYIAKLKLILESNITVEDKLPLVVAAYYDLVHEASQASASLQKQIKPDDYIITVIIPAEEIKERAAKELEILMEKNNGKAA